MSWDIEVHEKVYQRLANEIFFRILRGEYALGAKLPSYIDFAKEAGRSGKNPQHHCSRILPGFVYPGTVSAQRYAPDASSGYLTGSSCYS